MKITTIVFGLICFNGTLCAQVGIGTPTPASSAILDLSSTVKGFLPPRLTTAQIKSMVSPDEGLIVYNLTVKKPCFYNGIRWSYYDTAYVLPEPGRYWGEAGGIVLSLDGSGLHGIAGATEDQSSSAVYGCSGIDIPGATAIAIGTGQANTNDIIAGCGMVGIAAKLCDDLVLNGQSDWYLPSKNELHLFFPLIQYFTALTGTYISSSQVNSTSVYMEAYPGGVPLEIDRSLARKVRAIRNF